MAGGGIGLRDRAIEQFVKKFHATLVHIAQLHIFTLGQAHLIEHGKAGTKARNQYGFQIDPAARNNFRGCFIDVKINGFRDAEVLYFARRLVLLRMMS